MDCPTCNAKKNMNYYSDAYERIGSRLTLNLEPFVYSNAFPSSCDDRISIEESLSSLSTKSALLNDILAHQDDAISKLSIILQRYEDSRQQTLCEQSRIQDLLERHRQALSSPIRQLPADILREIFLLVSSNAADVTQFPWTATHICAEWRTIAMHTPMLWSKIHVITTLPSRVPCDMGEIAKLESVPSKEVVCRALELSRDVPLVISFRIKERPRKRFQMLELLMDHAPRWKVAYLSNGEGGMSLGDLNELHRLRGRIPNLESLSIVTVSMASPLPKNVFSIAPRLSKLAISNIFWEEVVFPWQQIKRLVFDGFYSIPYILRALRSAQNVKHLTFSPMNELKALDLDTVPIALPTIRCLDINHDRINPLLPHINLPGLQKLCIDHGGIVEQGNLISLDFMTRVGRLLISSGCALTHATFLPVVEFGPAFEDVITLCPTLTYLDVGFVPSRENIDLVFSFMNQRSVIPVLQSLRITFKVCNIWEDCPRIGEQLVEMAMMRKDSLRVFEASVCVKKSQGGTAILSSADKASLETLKADGMSIKVSVTIEITRWQQSLEFTWT